MRNSVLFEGKNSADELARIGLIAVAKRLTQATVATISLVVLGCASVSPSFQVENTKVAEQLGFPYCRVSVPISQSDVINDARRLGNPHPEQNLGWIQITQNFLPGDQLRIVDCLKSSGSTYFYALIRNDSIVYKFYSSIFD